MANRTRDTANLVSDNNLYVNITTDKVGIGTTNPTSKLTVQGDVLVSGVLTATNLVGTALSISGISTIANFRMSPVGTGATVGGIGVTYYGDGSQLTGIGVSVASYAERAGIATNVIGGIASVTSLDVSGITTLRSIVGTALSISGISTIANFRMSPVGTGATVGGIGVTYYGDGLNLTGIVTSIVAGTNITISPSGTGQVTINSNSSGGGSISISTNTTNQSQFLTYAIGTGNTTGLGVTTTGLVFNPSTGNLGIGTITPTAKLDVRGDVSIASTLGIGTVIDIVPYDTLNSGTLSWEGSAGQLFSITNNLTTGSIYSVNDVSGIPSIDVDANGTIQLGPYGGNIGLGTTNPTSKLHVVGDVRVSGASTFGGIVELDSSLRDFYNNVGVAGSVLISTGAGVSWSASTSSAAAVTISNDSTTYAERYVMFEDITTGTVQTVNVSSTKLQFIPSTGTLKATYFRGRGATSSMANYWARQTWTSRNSAADNSWSAIAWSPELRMFAAVSSTGTNRVMTSPNGINWTSQAATTANNWRGICWAAELGLFVAVSWSGTANRVMTSPNGTTWTTQTQSFNKDWQSVCWSPELGRLVAVSNYNGLDCVMYSPNGINWTITNGVQDNQWYSVVWASELGLFVAVSGAPNNGSGSQRVMTSTDGINWTGRTAAAQNVWVGLCWSPELGLFVAVSYDGSGNRVMTSPDGINWTSRTSAADNQWLSVCWAAELGLFVAVSNNNTNRVMTSPDGINWTGRTAAADIQWTSVCWSPEQSILAAVSDSGTGTRVMTSP